MTFSRRCDDDDKEINNFFVNQIMAIFKNTFTNILPSLKHANNVIITLLVKVEVEKVFQKVQKQTLTRAVCDNKRHIRASGQVSSLDGSAEKNEKNQKNIEKLRPKMCENGDF